MLLFALPEKAAPRETTTEQQRNRNKTAVLSFCSISTSGAHSSTAVWQKNAGSTENALAKVALLFCRQTAAKQKKCALFEYLPKMNLIILPESTVFQRLLSFV